MLRLSKVMTRNLTPEEEKEILDFMKSDSQPTTDDAVKHFEAKWNMPVTYHCVTRICIQAYLDEKKE